MSTKTAAASIRAPFELRPTAVPGVFTPPPLPADFDLSTASEASLLRHGVMFRRPTPGDPPEAQQLWKAITSRSWEQIDPVFEAEPGRVHLMRDPLKQADGSYTDNAWAGAVVDGTFTGAIGDWVVPTVSRPSEPQGEEGGWHSSSWIGIDGGSNASNDVLQAGVEQHVDANGNATYVAWYEWYAPEQAGSPAYINQINITNMPVSPGQEMTCMVAIGGGTGHLYFGNATLGKYVQLALAPPPGASDNGSTAEWIMEAPDYGIPNSSLPKFTPVVFKSAMACTGKGVVNADTGDIYNIVGYGKTLTSVSLSSYQVTIDFTG